MAATDITLPAFIDVTKLTPARVFTCDVHGVRKFVIQFNGDINRVRCIDCFEDTLPNRVRSIV
jgi:hypothetical protein